MQKQSDRSNTLTAHPGGSLVFVFFLLCMVQSSAAQEIYLENTSKALYQLEILQPAGMNTDTSLRSILLIPRQPGTNSKIKILLNGKSEKDADQMVPALFSMTCQRAAGFISEGPRFNTLIPEHDSIFFPPGIQRWEDIESFCKQANTEVLAVLERVECPVEIRSNLSATGINLAGDINDRKGIQGTPSTLGSVTTEAVFTWQLYFYGNRLAETKKIKSRDQISDIQVDSEKELINYMNEELPNILDRISTDEAQQFAHLVSPAWVSTFRSYFDKGNHDMRLASRFLQNGEIDKAAALWEELARSNKKGIAKHARFNLLLICELDGKYTEGLQLAEKLVQEFNMPEAVSYCEIMRTRIKEQELLDQQFPKE